MTIVVAAITISLDGYITGPNDGPGRGLGDGGERLHYWVFGGPWSYASESRGEPTGTDKEYLDGAMARAGAVVVGRGMYEAADAWGGQNPFGVPLFVVTHRPEDAPSEGGFTFVDGLDEAIARARQAAGGKDISVGGGADVIRQALRGGHVDELAISIAPLILGGGKRLFDGFEQIIELGARGPAPVTLCHAHHLPDRVLKAPWASRDALAPVLHIERLVDGRLPAALRLDELLIAAVAHLEQPAGVAATFARAWLPTAHDAIRHDGEWAQTGLIALSDVLP